MAAVQDTLVVYMRLLIDAFRTQITVADVILTTNKD